MIVKNKKEVIGVMRSGKTVDAKYGGIYLFWQGVRSCFGSGGWINDKPWLNDEAWKNN